MLSFATEFPVHSDRTATHFVHAVRDWILGSPHTVLRAEDFSDVASVGDWSVSRANERLDILGIASPTQEHAVAKYVRSDGRLEWETVIGFSRHAEDTWTAVRVSCESTHAATRLPPAKKPVVVRTLLDKLGGGRDGALNVISSPHRLAQVDIDLAARLISGRAACRLPIVYVSAGFFNEYNIESDQLASDLAGMAHVVVEPNRPFSTRLMREVDAENVYGGTVGIYWPDGAGRRSFFLGRSYESKTEIQAAVTDEVRSALVNRRPLDRCTWGHVQSLSSRAAFDALIASGSREVNRYIEEFDKEIKARDEKRRTDEREIARLQAEVRKYEARMPIGTGMTLQTGQEQDLYPGETLAVVRSAIKDAVARLLKDSRRCHILQSILDANPDNGEMDRMRETIKELLRGSTTVDKKIKRGLEELGFSISEVGKHFKVVFQGDERYVFTLAKTGSDHRGGLNAAGDISRLLF